jgi:hypothetical protein
MGPIYQLSPQQEQILIKYINKMISENKIRLSSSSVESSILFVPKLNGRRLRLYIDYLHLNDYTMKVKTPLPIMEALLSGLRGADFITQMDLP